MRIAVVSDTHGQAVHTLRAVRMLESFQPELVLHCGDIGSAEIVPLFSAWPTHFVFGNVDGDQESLRRAIAAAGKTCHGRFGRLDLASLRVAFLHGDDLKLLAATSSSGQWDLVCHGHTHVARQHRQGRTLVLNPGAVYRANPHSIAVVELPSLEVSLVRL
jgi:putative phosphoesterase